MTDNDGSSAVRVGGTQAGAAEIVPGHRMTDPQTPATEAGRRLNDWLRLSDNWPEVTSEESILAIEAEARAIEHQITDEGDGAPWVYMAVADYQAALDEARADALREAAERVRALDAPKRYENDANGNWFTTDMEYGWDCGVDAVLAILDPQP